MINKVQLINKNAFASPPVNVFRDVDMVQIRDIINTLTDLVGELLMHEFKIDYASKSSAVDAGELYEMAIDDDFFYICVEAGEAGSARWKRLALLYSP